MSKPKIKTDTVKVSRLGCMRKSTVISSDDAVTVEHVEVWVPNEDDQLGSEEKSKGRTNSCKTK